MLVVCDGVGGSKMFLGVEWQKKFGGGKRGGGRGQGTANNNQHSGVANIQV